MASAKRKRKPPRNVRKGMVKATTEGMVALAPFLGVLGLRGYTETPAPPPAETSVSASATAQLPFTAYGGLDPKELMQAVDPTGPDTSAGFRQAGMEQAANEIRSREVIRLIAESHAEERTGERAASVIQGGFTPGAISLDAALAVLMSLLAKYAQAVLDKLIEDSADATSSRIEKLLGKAEKREAASLEQLLQGIRDEFAKAPAGGTAAGGRTKPLTTRDFNHVLTRDAFTAIQALRDELKKRGTNLLPSVFLAQPDPPGNPRYSPLPGVPADIYFANQADDATSVQPVAIPEFLQQPGPDDLIPPAAASPVPATQFPAGTAQWASIFATSGDVVATAFRDAAMAAYQALGAQLSDEDAKFLAGYLRYRAANEALNYLPEADRLMVLQRIVDTPLASPW
jgi:hypothetical protein